MTVSDNLLKQAHAIAAEVVAIHSQRYIPLFEILDHELRRREECRARAVDSISQEQLMTRRAQRRKRRINSLERDEQS